MGRCFLPCRTLAVAAIVAILSAPALAYDAGSANACQTAGTDAELLHAVPPGLLLAIGRVESGRRHPATGMMVPWPWTINASGAGRQFETDAEALDTTRLLRKQGISSIDVGCFQINLAHHPDAFASLENAFDPHANADYAARFLAALRIHTGSWEEAVAAYHSATPERGGPYRNQVLAGWAQGGTTPKSSPAPSTQSNPVRIWTASLQQGVRIWTPSAPGTSPSVIVIRSASAREPSVSPVSQATAPLVSYTRTPRLARAFVP